MTLRSGKYQLLRQFSASLLDRINSRRSKYYSHVVLYHSVALETNDTNSISKHNVHPDIFYKQIRWLKSNFDVIKIDEFLQLDDFSGKAAITFDDGYPSVFQYAIPLLNELNLPATVFLNGCFVENKPFWRNAINYIESHGYKDKFYAFLASKYNYSLSKEKSLYKESKKYVHDSSLMATAANEYLKSINISINTPNVDIMELIKSISGNKNITYGNHTYHHYVLSSIPLDRQKWEIEYNAELLERNDLDLSLIFSIPFGGRNDFNEETLRCICDAGYKGILTSRQTINGREPDYINIGTGNRLLTLDRYMPPNDYLQFQRQVYRYTSHTN